jgi:putative DNA primase/helicase
MDITFKLFMATNEKFCVDDPSDGLWRRMRFIPITYQVPDTEKIKNYAEKILFPEISGILNWIIEGYKKYKEYGLEIPLYIQEATKEYRKNSDIIEEFIEDCCVVGPEHKILRTNLHERFKRWCFGNGIRTVSSTRTFYTKMDSKGFQTKITNGNRFFSGLNMKN